MLRKCDICGKPMKSGYVIGGGLEYYCSDKCLHKIYTEKEWNDLYDEGNSDSYWTEWENYGDENKTENLLLELGFNINSKGFDYWLQAIELYKNKKRKLIDLYEILANTNDTTYTRVERCLRFSSETAKNNIKRKYNYNNKLNNRAILKLLSMEV